MRAMLVWLVCATAGCGAASASGFCADEVSALCERACACGPACGVRYPGRDGAAGMGSSQSFGNEISAASAGCRSAFGNYCATNEAQLAASTCMIDLETATCADGRLIVPPSCVENLN